jgi:hypothetical protein
LSEFFKTIRNITRSPVFPGDDDLTQLARFVNNFAWIILASAGIFSVIWLISAPGQAARLILTAPLFALGGVILAFVRRRQIGAANQLLVWGLWVTLLVAAWFSGGVHAPAMGGLIVVVLLASLLLERRVTRWCAISTITALLGLALAEELGIISDQGYSTPIAIWASYVAYIVVASLFLQMATTNIRESLLRARQEIQQREVTEAALRESEAIFNLAFQSSPIAMSISARGAGLLDVNRALETITGYSREELIGHSALELGLWLEPERQTATVEQLFREGRISNVEFAFKRKDGSRGFGLASAVVVQINGQDCALASIVDITERKKAEQALNEAEVRYRSLVEQIPVVTYRDKVDADGSNEYISPQIEDLLGFSPAEFDRNPNFWQTLVHPDDLQGALADISRYIKSGERTRMEYRLRTKDGRWVWVRDEAVVVTDAAGKPLFVQGVFTDITEQKRADEEIRRLNAELEGRVRQRTAQLEATNKELEAFSYTVSHDLRVPLRAIDGFSRILADEFAGEMPDTARRYLSLVRDNTRRMGTLIEDLIAFSRMSRASLQREPVNPKRIAEEIWSERKVELGTRKIQFAAAHLPPCSADPRLFRIALANLIDNAIKFTRQQAEATIEVGVREEDGRGVYFVRDNGTGFDMRYADKLFGVFQRLHREDEFEGSGIGLATVKRIINRHGGDIWVEAAPGQGATFFFTLPDET